MHFLIGGLCVLASAQQNDCDNQIKSGNNLWVAASQLLDGNFAAYLINPTDSSFPDSSQAMNQDCNAVYVLCPAIEPTLMLPFRNQAPAQYDDASATPPEFYHTNILKGFARKVRAGVNVSDYAQDQEYLATTYPVNQGHNYQYFTFASDSKGAAVDPTSFTGPLARFGGGDFNFQPDLHPYQLVSLAVDEYMLKWVTFYAYAMLPNNNPDSLKEAILNDFVSRAYVSQSVNLCWSMLTSGFLHNISAEPRVPPVPVENARAHVSVWKSQPCEQCGNVISFPENYKKLSGCNSLSMCKAFCLQLPLCAGVLYNTVTKSGQLMHNAVTYSKSRGSWVKGAHSC